MNYMVDRLEHFQSYDPNQTGWIRADNEAGALGSAAYTFTIGAMNVFLRHIDRERNLQ